VGCSVITNENENGVRRHDGAALGWARRGRGRRRAEEQAVAEPRPGREPARGSVALSLQIIIEAPNMLASLL
jgi:hypothetical protein